MNPKNEFHLSSFLKGMGAMILLASPFIAMLILALLSAQCQPSEVVTPSAPVVASVAPTFPTLAASISDEDLCLYTEGEIATAIEVARLNGHEAVSRLRTTIVRFSGYPAMGPVSSSFIVDTLPSVSQYVWLTVVGIPDGETIDTGRLFVVWCRDGRQHTAELNG